MRDLFIDCDGVIYDTIKYAFINMKELNIDISDNNNITKYFKNCDWNSLIDNGGIINDNCKKILQLKDSNIFRIVAIATHHCSFEEGITKNERFNIDIPNVKVFNIPRKIAKHYALNAKGHILVDDDIRKINGWVNDGGYGVLFTQDINELIYPNSSNNFFITNNLLDLYEINDYIELNKKEKVLRR